MIYSIHPEAAQDMADAVSFYQQSASSRVAGKFERVARLLTENPGFGTPFDLPRRIFPLRVFPYSIVYRPVDGGIRILAVRHQRRAPGVGQDRH